jgi:undecaprenyl-diphosphatase
VHDDQLPSRLYHLAVNYDVLKTINGLSGNRAVDDIMRFAAQYLVFLVFALFAVLCVDQLRRRQFVALFGVVATLGFAFVFGLVAATVHPEQRPITTHPGLHELIKHSAGQSFPSDHALASFAIALAILIFVSRPWGVLLLALAALIAFARVYVGVHYPGDVLGSLLIAGLAALVAVGVTPMFKRVTIDRRLISDIPEV